MDNRRENLRLLGIFHFVYAGLVILGSFIPILWLTLAGLWWPELTSELNSGEFPLLLTGTVGLSVAGFGVLVAWVWAAVLVVAGRSLVAARRHTYCLVVAAIACLSFPVGTLLGIVTLVVINRNDVRELFEVRAF
ncbi:MAG: hypothetical protein R3D98_11325 [Candidatus Krumholzibacteriia bacterium]